MQKYNTVSIPDEIFRPIKIGSQGQNRGNLGNDRKIKILAMAERFLLYFVISNISSLSLSLKTKNYKQKNYPTSKYCPHIWMILLQSQSRNSQ